MTTTSDHTETATIGPGLRPVPAPAPDPADAANVLRGLIRLADDLSYTVVPNDAYAELVAAGQEAAAFLQAANAEVRRLRQALAEIAERSHGVRSFEQSARLAGIHEYATSVLDPGTERVIDGSAP
ncbi:MAG: hypothetical protein R2749_29825 [Acidimicrobiales bacterium]